MCDSAICAKSEISGQRETYGPKTKPGYNKHFQSSYFSLGTCTTIPFLFTCGPWCFVDLLTVGCSKENAHYLVKFFVPSAGENRQLIIYCAQVFKIFLVDCSFL